MKAFQSLIKLSLALTLLGLSACKPSQQEQSQSSPKVPSNTASASTLQMDHMDPNMQHMHMEMDAGQPSGMSIYNLESHWQNQDGQDLQLKQLGGKVQILAMIYSSCKNACPRIIADMKALETQLQHQYPEQVRFVLVSIDPKVDTPARLKQLAQKSQLQHWTLLHGEEDDVLELAAVLGVKYKKISATAYAHSNIISVLNPQGEVVHQQIGLNVDPQASLQAVEKLFSTPIHNKKTD